MAHAFQSPDGVNPSGDFILEASFRKTTTKSYVSVRVSFSCRSRGGVKRRGLRAPLHARFAGSSSEREERRRYNPRMPMTQDAIPPTVSPRPSARGRCIRRRVGA
jgi:hypothetical protein